MTPVTISKPERWVEDGWHVSSASITINDKAHQLKFKASEGPLAKGSNAFFSAALLTVMKIGQPLHVSGTVSPQLLAAVQTIQTIFHRWFPEFQKILDFV